MASLTLSSSFTASRHLTRAKPQLHPRSHSSTLSLNGVSRLFKAPSIKHRSATGVKASLGLSGSYFEGDYDYDFDESGLVEEEGFGLGMSVAQATAAAALLEDREEPPCPPGCRRYECIVILRPDVTEEQRVAFIQRYEEILVAGGAMYVEVFNRGILPISYSIQKYNKDGTKGTYFEGIISSKLRRRRSPRRKLLQIEGCFFPFLCNMVSQKCKSFDSLGYFCALAVNIWFSN
ncbi:30S ribosomal protein S6 [Rhynchospora pubera]|uniref:30S ribosomal protein S6 n=1 Tax=Rhynchospora pubera TaxID=906938 RepID=A0AAV8DGD4_9POAL|nr:30S ribosomal protein S6 [Rhynchospora pubera]